MRTVLMPWTTAAGLVATGLTLVFLLWTVAFGIFWLSADWSALACFDGHEPGCDDREPGAPGLGAIRASSWIAGAAAVVALIAAFRISWRLSRRSQLVAVLALDAGVVAVAVFLWSRL